MEAMRQPIRFGGACLGADRVKPERNLGAAKLASTKGGTNLRPSPAQVTEPPYADPPVRWWEGRSREASPYPDFRQFTTEGDCRSFAASLNPKLVIGLSNGIVSDAPNNWSICCLLRLGAVPSQCFAPDAPSCSLARCSGVGRSHGVARTFGEYRCFVQRRDTLGP